MVIAFAMACVSLFGQVSAAAPPAEVPPCPEGYHFRVIEELGTFALPADLPPGTEVVLTRLILEPGVVVQPEAGDDAMLFVTSGTLETQYPRWPQGLHFQTTLRCEPDSGVYSGGGMISVDAEGWMNIEPHSTLIAEGIALPPIRNVGDVPVEVLQVSLYYAELDPVTGQPIGNQLVTDRGNKADRQEKRNARQAATPTP